VWVKQQAVSPRDLFVMVVDLEWIDATISITEDLMVEIDAAVEKSGRPLHEVLLPPFGAWIASFRDGGCDQVPIEDEAFSRALVCLSNYSKEGCLVTRTVRMYRPHFDAFQTIAEAVNHPVDIVAGAAISHWLIAHEVFLSESAREAQAARLPS
jgi:hypothetical protein